MTHNVVASAQSNMNLVRVDGHDEPMVCDGDLAKALEFSQARDIRKLIKRMKESGELAGIHSRSTVARQSTRNGGTREYVVTEYLLTEEEAIIVAMRSETKKAIEVRRQIAAVYKAWRHGERAALLDKITQLEAGRTDVEKLRLELATIRAEIGTVSDPCARIGEDEACELKHSLKGLAHARTPFATKREYACELSRVHAQARSVAGFPAMVKGASWSTLGRGKLSQLRRWISDEMEAARNTNFESGQRTLFELVRPMAN